MAQPSSTAAEPVRVGRPEPPGGAAPGGPSGEVNKIIRIGPEDRVGDLTLDASHGDRHTLPA